MQAVCKKFGIRDKTLPLEVTLLLVQVVEEFSLVLGRSDLHQTVIVQELTEDTGTDPPGGIGVKAHALREIKFADCLHQADIPFLDEIQHISSGLTILPGYRD